MLEFASSFGERITGFLEFRTARGFKRETHLRSFIKFDRWCTKNHPEQTELTQELVHEWIDDPEASANEISQRIVTMRLFGAYLHAVGESVYVLPEKYYPHKNKGVPHVFTDEELSALFASIDCLPPTAGEPFLNEIAPVMFRLIYTCGLRPNEGRELLRKNVNFHSGEILIEKTKRNKDRFVVMSDEMRAFAHQYEQRRQIFAKGNPYFFPSAHGGPLSSNAVYAALNKAWSLARLDGRHPTRIRVYDLRHQFASMRLNRWLDEGENLLAMLPFLRTCMGHGSLTETAYYIHILPENLLKSSSIDWEKFNTLFPEVEI